MVGFFDNGTPYIEIEVSSWNPAAPTRFNVVVDTGFTGFLLLPLLSAFPVGLILHSTMDITLADGSTQTKLACLGNIHFDGQQRNGTILIEEQDTDALVGIEFLRAFNLQLTLDAVAGTLELKPR